MSISEIFSFHHDPRAFSLSLTRGESCCHTFALELPPFTLRLRPSGAFCDPLRDLLRAAGRILPSSRDDSGSAHARSSAFEWDCEPVVYSWVIRPIRKTDCIRLRIACRGHVNLARSSEIVDTVLDAHEFARQVWMNALTLLREGGLVSYGSHHAFPLSKFFPVHAGITGEHVPASLKEELAVLNRLA